ncbi:glutathione S-transferase C-terminal domain-containing protein [Actinoplanes sp. NPDC051494]|uniref:glutathione S-transferase C-terminal domain-containing protein n=1 Tax=Actinoplanes sp. NPDC051494 TaxID=3363907 RepID=UPI0037B84D23
MTTASPVDVATHGEYQAGRLFTANGRITEPDQGRYHVYGAWFCPWYQRVAITRALAGLVDVVSVSYVDGERDGRGWAFRGATGPDPVNGFTLLRQAYEASEPGFDGHVSVPALWDRSTSRLVSNDARTIGIDLATRFQDVATPLVATYPAPLADKIEELDRWLAPAVTSPDRETVLETFEQLDARLAHSRFLLGEDLTEADIRLWVRLVRWDVGPNARRTINPGLHVYPHLWSYARALYKIPAFRDTTAFATFTAPDAIVPDWS